MLTITLYILIGIGAGFLAGLLGIGGGIIVVPGLAAIFNYLDMPANLIMHMAASTSLASVMFSAAVAVFNHQRSKTIDWQLFRKIAIGIVFGTITGVSVADLLASQTLRILFSFFMLFVGIKMLLDKKTVIEKKLQFGQIGYTSIGFCIGILSGLLGIGGGVISMPIFLRLGLTAHIAAATSSACVLLLATVGALSFILTGWNHTTSLPPGSTGYIYWPAVIVIALTSMIFVPLGTKVARRLSGKILKRVFAGFVVLVAIEMLLH